MVLRKIRGQQQYHAVTCPSCGYDANSCDNFCYQCGSPIKELEREKIKEIWKLTDAGKDLRPRYCEECGEKLPLRGQRCCTRCGTEIDYIELKSVFNRLNHLEKLNDQLW